MPHSPRYAAPELSDRVLRLLGALVREYIEHGEPVSSQWLAGPAGCAGSAATVRNVLARSRWLRVSPNGSSAGGGTSPRSLHS